jgi:hypothetical protein
VAGADGQRSDAGLPSGVESGGRENVFGFAYSASFKQLQLYWTQVRLTADGSEEQQRDGVLIAGVMKTLRPQRGTDKDSNWES